VRKGLPANDGPFTFTHFVADAWKDNEWKFPLIREPYHLFDPNETFMAVCGRRNTDPEGELGIEFTRLQTPEPGWWPAYDNGKPSHYFFALRLRSAWRGEGATQTNLGDDYFGSATRPEDSEWWWGTHSVCVRTISFCWPVIVDEVDMNWVNLATGVTQDTEDSGDPTVQETAPTNYWLSWNANTSIQQDSFAQTEGSLALDDKALPGQEGPLSDWHGRRFVQLYGAWRNEAGTKWTGGSRWLMVSKGPARGDSSSVPLVSILQLVQDVSGVEFPIPDGKLLSEVVADAFLRSGIPATAQAVSTSFHRAPLQTPGKSRHFTTEELENGQDLLQKACAISGFRVYTASDHVFYCDALGEPTSGQEGRRFLYSDGKVGVSLPASWRISELSTKEPESEDREVTDIEVQCETEMGPYRTRLRIISPDRVGDMAVVGGVGRQKIRVVKNPDITTIREADWLCRVLGQSLVVDSGDYSVTGPADPDLYLADVGALALSRTSLVDTQDVEVRAITEQATQDGHYRMVAQMCAARGTPGGGIPS
jgi:hypothetical protein